MQKVMDTFLHFIADNLPYTIHPIRHDSEDPSSSDLQLDAINIEFLDYRPQLGSSTLRVVLDVMYNDERTAVAVVETIYDLLSAAYYTELKDYAVPSSPVEVGSNVFWDRNNVSFSRISNDNYTHYSCILTLRHK